MEQILCKTVYLVLFRGSSELKPVIRLKPESELEAALRNTLVLLKVEHIQIQLSNINLGCAAVESKQKEFLFEVRLTFSIL